MRASPGRDARTGRESSPLREVAEGEFTGGRLTAKLTRLTIVVITSNAWFMPQGIQAGTEQRKPSSSLEEEAFVALQRTADRLQRRVAEMLKQHGLSPTQYNALRILRGAGPEGLPCREAAERMINRDPDMTRLLDRLERRGLVERNRQHSDRRVITTRITNTGLDLLKGLDRPVEDFHRQLLGSIGEAKLQLLVQLLETAREASVV